MALTPGDRLDRYEIISLLGKGGMGEVYLAQDTRLDRKIALKLLPAQFTQDAGRVRRFVQEAKASSALNHPNILMIFEIGQTDSTHYIATEFIDGETLRARFKREPMGIDEVLDVAQQIASALTAAHAAGIVHRDIKPENIVLRRDGIVKVLDFGLVKLTEDKRAASIDLEGDTRALVMTDTGTVVGTAPYMSPEQARGLDIDARTDIWSLGVVMYEMIAGRAPFQGETTSHVIVSIIEQEQPSLGRFAPSAPPELQRIVRKALAKDRDNRYQTSRDLMIDLKNLRRDLDLQHEIEVSAAPRIRASAAPSSGDSPAATASKDSIGTSRADSEAATVKEATVHSRSSAEYLTSEIRRQKTRASIALTLFLLSSVGLLYAVYRFGSGSKPVFTHFQNISIKKLTTLGNVSDVVISPDGKYVVYDVTEGNRQGLWTKYLPTGSTVQIVPPAEVLGLGSTTFSPDGNFVYYVLWDKNNPNGSLFMVPVLGGNAKKVLENIRSSTSFSPDGKRFVFVRILDSNATALFIANSDGTNERQLAALSGSDRFSVNGPSWSPDGKLIACATGSTTGSQRMTISVASVDNGAIKPLTAQQWSGVNRVAWFADGSGIVFLAAPLMTTDRQIWQLSYPSGEVRRITNDLNSYGDASLGVTSDSAVVVSMQVTRGSDIWIAPSNAVAASQARQITMRNQRQNGARGMSWMPDGRIVYSSNASDNADIWSMNADGSNQKQLTDDPQADVNPVVSPDGRYVVFQSLRAGNWNIWRMQSDGNNLKQLTSGDNDVDPDVTPDGQWVIYCAKENANTTIWKMPIEGGAPVRLAVATQATNPSVSPDGKQVAYIEVASNSKSPYKLVLISIEGGIPVKTFDIPLLASDLHWTPDGRALVYLGRGAFAGVASIWRQSLDGTAPFPIVEFKPDSIYAFAYSRDGRQLALSRGSLTRDAVLISDSK